MTRYITASLALAVLAAMRALPGPSFVANPLPALALLAVTSFGGAALTGAHRTVAGGTIIVSLGFVAGAEIDALASRATDAGQASLIVFLLIPCWLSFAAFARLGNRVRSAARI